MRGGAAILKRWEGEITRKKKSATNLTAQPGAGAEGDPPRRASRSGIPGRGYYDEERASKQASAA